MQLALTRASYHRYGSQWAWIGSPNNRCDLTCWFSYQSRPRATNSSIVHVSGDACLDTHSSFYNVETIAGNCGTLCLECSALWLERVDHTKRLLHVGPYMFMVSAHMTGDHVTHKPVSAQHHACRSIMQRGFKHRCRLPLQRVNDIRR